jgi:hypothetical protein
MKHDMDETGTEHTPKNKHPTGRQLITLLVWCESEFLNYPEISTNKSSQSTLLHMMPAVSP